MPIVGSEIKLYASVDSPSIGGAITGTVISTGVINNLFPNVSAANAATGITEYRCIYVKNINPTLSLLNTKVFLSSNTPSDSTVIHIGLGVAAVSVNESSGVSPTEGVSYSTVSTYDTGLVIGTLAPNAFKSIWVRRTVSMGAGAAAIDGCTITVQGDTEV